MRRKNLEGDFQLWKGKQLIYPAFQLAACMVVSKNGNEDLEGEENLDGSKI